MNVKLSQSNEAPLYDFFEEWSKAMLVAPEDSGIRLNHISLKSCRQYVQIVLQINYHEPLDLTMTFRSLRLAKVFMKKFHVGMLVKINLLEGQHLGNAPLNAEITFSL